MTTPTPAGQKATLVERRACGRIAELITKVVSMPILMLDIALSAESLRAVYQGRANRVLLKSRDGQRVNLAAHHLRPFLTHAGIYGSFALEFNGQGQLLSLRQING